LKARKLRASALVVALLLPLALSACGDSDSDGGTTAEPASPSTSAAAAAAGDFTAAKDAVADRSQTDKPFPMPTDPVEMGNHKVAIVNFGVNSPYGVVMEKYYNEAAGATGWDFKQFDAQQDVTKVSGFILQAVQEDYEAIILNATSIDAVAAAAKTALDEGVTLVCISCAPETGDFAGKVIDINADWYDQGKAIAAAIVARSGADAKVVRYNEPAFYSVVQVTKGVVDGVKEYCPECDPVTVEDFAVQDLLQAGPPAWSAFLASHPAGSYTDLAAPFEYAAGVMQATAEQAGRTEISISTTAALSEFLNEIKTGKVTGFASKESELYQVYAGIDLTARALAGQDLWDATNLFSPLVTTDNVDSFLANDGEYIPDGQDFVSGFKALWEK
jgi:ABC-type sugar transport system substrate-binding protein